MRARNITDRICRDFCEWLRSLGDSDKVIDEEVLGDMFEIDFTGEASRTMEVQIVTKCTGAQSIAALVNAFTRAHAIVL